MTNGLEMESLTVTQEDMDIAALSDSQLYEMLKENNIAAGPIVDSTRNIYKKKLRKVFYGNEEDSVASGAESVESEEGEEANEEETEEEFLVINGEAEEKIINAQLEDEKDNKITTNTIQKDPSMEIKDEDNQKVLDLDDGGPYDSRSNFDDDQPSGVSRPVDQPSGLRKRFHEDETDSSQTNGDVFIGKSDATGEKVETLSGWAIKAVLFINGIMAVSIVAALLFFNSLNVNVLETVDSMQEAIQEATNKAAEEMDGHV